MPARFWNKVKIGSRHDCWLWLGHKYADGYGQFKFNYKAVRAHRMAYKLGKGPFNERLKVLHHCDVPTCCNPRHLFLGAPKDNTLDMLRKGRGRFYMKAGELHPRHKLTESAVAAIRRDYRRRTVTAKMLAERFNVSQRAIYHVLHKDRWAHVMA